MKLNWHEKCKKELLIKTNRILVSNMVKRPIADCFAGKPKKTVTEKRVYIKFKHANVGLSNESDLDNIFIWVHEFTEHVVGRLILEMMVEEGLTLERMTDIISNGIFIKDIYGRWYNPTAKHLIAALCTNSNVDGIRTTSEEYAKLFRFEKGPVAQLESAAPFDPLRKTGVRCRFDFGRGLQSKCSFYSRCENDWDYKAKIKEDISK